MTCCGNNEVDNNDVKTHPHLSDMQGSPKRGEKVSYDKKVAMVIKI